MLNFHLEVNENKAVIIFPSKPLDPLGMDPGSEDGLVSLSGALHFPVEFMFVLVRIV